MEGINIWPIYCRLGHKSRVRDCICLMKYIPFYIDLCVCIFYIGYYSIVGISAGFFLEKKTLSGPLLAAAGVRRGNLTLSWFYHLIKVRFKADWCWSAGSLILYKLLYKFILSDTAVFDVLIWNPGYLSAKTFSS